eukprot:2340889-Amphidinium_carterae.2
MNAMQLCAPLLEGVWHEARAGDQCVRCGDSGEAVEDLEHIVHHCPHWDKERRESGLPTTVFHCGRLHGLLPAPEFLPSPTHELALAQRH